MELILNGVSLGRRKVEALEAAFELTYAPGELLAVGYTKGKEDGRFCLQTAKEPVKLGVWSDKDTLIADGRSAAFVTVDLLDANGLSNRFTKRRVTVSVEGAGVLAGFGSADPQAEGSYQSDTWETFDGRVMAAVRSTTKSGEIKVHISAEGCEPVQIVITAISR